MQFLYDKLKWMRETTGKTQAQMAKGCGVSTRTWVNYEQGVSVIPTMRLVAVSVYCYIDIGTVLADAMPKRKKLKQARFEVLDDQTDKSGVKFE